MHRDPGQDVEISRFHHAALGSYADNLCEDALKQSRDLFGLNLALDGIADTLPRFISSELAGVANHDNEEALSRMDQDRTSVVKGQSVSIRETHCGRRKI